VKNIKDRDMVTHIKTVSINILNIPFRPLVSNWVKNVLCM
jgi:hypothetical protein